ncbi:MAG TPA: PilZ domain-containing protein [bacterium]
MGAQPSSNPQERRQYIRLGFRMNATYHVVDSDDQRRTLTRNLSGGGVRFATHAQVPSGTELVVEVKFPDRPQPVRFTSEVVWSEQWSDDEGGERHWETGVRITDISKDDHAYLQQYAALNTPPP